MFTRLLFSGFIQRPTAEASELIFTQNSQTMQFCARMCLFGVRKQKLNTSTPYSGKKTLFLGPILMGLEKNFRRKPLYNGDAPCKLPLIDIVAL